MSVIAKFYVQSIERPQGTSTASKVTLGAVCRGVENATWAQYTPSGTITFSCLNDAATDYFKEHEEYEVLFTHAPKPTAGDGHAIQLVKTKFGQYICGTCGGYPNLPDGVRYDAATPADLDWSAHEELFSAK